MTWQISLRQNNLVNGTKLSTKPHASSMTLRLVVL